MVFKILRFYIKLIKSEIFFKKPELSDIIFLGRPTYNESFFCKQNFDLLLANKKNTIAVWHEYYNLFVIFICLIKFKFTFLEYCQEYINLTKPKLIISFLDNYDLIYKLQGKNCKKIVIQNGYRFGSNIINFKLRKIKKKICRFCFCLQ